MALLEIRQAAFAYPGKPVFHELDFALEAGEIACLIGPNGCGKTTLLDCLLGLKSLQAGDIQVCEQPLNRYRPADLARKIAYVPQAHERTFPYTVLQAVLLGRTAYTTLFGSPDAEDESIARACLEQVGIAHLADRPYTHVSGGEMQLILLARALAQQTAIIIMDEPTAHLDFRNELVFLEMVAQLVQEQGIAILMATHSPNHSFYFEGKHLNVSLSVMHEGRLRPKGRPAAILTEPTLLQVYAVEARLISYRLADGQELKQIVPIATKPPEREI